MRRRRARTLLIGLLATSLGCALFLDRTPRVQAAATAVTTPVAHPANRLGGFVSNLFGDDAALDPESPDAPRDAQAVYAENVALRAQLSSVIGQLRALQRVNTDRAKLGSAIRERTTPAIVTAQIQDGGEVIQLTGAGDATEGTVALHTGGLRGGIAGRVEAVAAGGQARVRLITDPSSRPIEARFARFDADLEEWVILDTEPFVVSGAGSGRAAVGRHRADDLERAGVAPGTWVILADREWPELLAGQFLARVAAVEPLPQDAGFSRVVLDPPFDPTTLERGASPDRARSSRRVHCPPTA